MLTMCHTAYNVHFVVSERPLSARLVLLSLAVPGRDVPLS
jgi:hypothetical protein